MAHEHHHCDCQHERVKFCAKCKVVHCLDCKLEWNEPCRLSHSWGWTYPYYSSYPLGGTVSGATSQYTITAQAQSDSAPTFTATAVCEHN